MTLEDRLKIEEESVREDFSKKKEMFENLQIQEGWKYLHREFFEKQKEISLKEIQKIDCDIEQLRFNQGVLSFLNNLNVFIESVTKVSQETVDRIVFDIKQDITTKEAMNEMEE